MRSVTRTPRDDAQRPVARHRGVTPELGVRRFDLLKWQARRADLGRVGLTPMHAKLEGIDRDVTTTHDSCRRHSPLRRRRPGRQACAALPQRRLRHGSELEPRHPPSRREVPHGAVRRAGAREVGQIGRLLRTGGRRGHWKGHRRDRYRTADPRRVVSRRHDRGAIRGSAPRAGRWTGAHRRCLPDHHVSTRPESRRSAPSSFGWGGSCGSWQRSAARPGCLPPSPRTS